MSVWHLLASYSDLSLLYKEHRHSLKTCTVQVQVVHHIATGFTRTWGTLAAILAFSAFGYKTSDVVQDMGVSQGDIAVEQESRSGCV